MGILDVMNVVASEKKESAAPKKKTVTFDIEVWNKMEAKYGKTIEVKDVAKMIEGLFMGEFDIRAVKKG